jgi:hypothetical protein
MSNQMTIWLSSSQWEELEKHLPLEACPRRVGLPEFTLIQENDRRPLLDEAQYETLIGIARAHCSDFVPLLEQQTSGSLVFRHQFTAELGVETCDCLRFSRTITALSDSEYVDRRHAPLVASA